MFGVSFYINNIIIKDELISYYSQFPFVNIKHIIIEDFDIFYKHLKPANLIIVGIIKLQEIGRRHHSIDTCNSASTR